MFTGNRYLLSFWSYLKLKAVGTISHEKSLFFFTSTNSNPSLDHVKVFLLLTSARNVNKRRRRTKV